MDRGHFFEYPGVGHGASIVPGCPTDMMLAFLEDPFTAPDDACIAEMDLPQFVVPGPGAEAIAMSPFTNEQMGIQGVVPAGWQEASPGVYSRGSSALDMAVVLAQAAPGEAADLLNLVTRQLSLSAAPEDVGQREANGLTWTLYAVKVQGIPVDLALTESDGLALIVLLQSSAEEHEALYDAVFLPVVDGLVPLE